MNKLVFTLFTGFITLYCQLILGNLGWYLPLGLLGALYIALAFGKSWGIVAAMLTGMTLALLYGNAWNMLNIITFPLLAGFSSWWIEHHDEDINLKFYFPGVLAGVLAAFPALAQELFYWGEWGHFSQSILFTLLRMLWCAVVSGVLFEAILFAGEAATLYLGLPRFLTRKGNRQR